MSNLNDNPLIEVHIERWLLNQFIHL